MSFYILSMVVFLIVTLIVENIPLLFTERLRGFIKVAVKCNLLTSPLLTTVMFLTFGLIEEEGIVFAVLCVAEAAVIIIEAYAYRLSLDEKWSRCLIVSVITNLLSFAACIMIILWDISVIDAPRKTNTVIM